MELSPVKFRAGCDPEIFMQDRQGNLKSVIGLIGGTKWQPLQVLGLPLGFTLQQDNVAIEFGIPPAASVDEFIISINTIKNEGLKALPDLLYSKESCAIFPEEEMTTPESSQFGCEPDYNAWTGRMNKKPEPPHIHMRSAGGHIHVETRLPKKPVVRAMDLFISVPAVLMDSGEQRKLLYGKAGAYRPKPYGVEYRTPSNWWIFEDKLIAWVWSQTEKALSSVKRGWRLDGDGGRIIACINNNDKKLAQQLIYDYSLELV